MLESYNARAAIQLLLISQTAGLWLDCSGACPVCDCTGWRRRGAAKPLWAPQLPQRLPPPLLCLLTSRLLQRPGQLPIGPRRRGELTPCWLTVAARWACFLLGWWVASAPRLTLGCLRCCGSKKPGCVSRSCCAWFLALGTTTGGRACNQPNCGHACRPWPKHEGPYDHCPQAPGDTPGPLPYWECQEGLQVNDCRVLRRDRLQTTSAQRVLVTFLGAHLPVRAI